MPLIKPDGERISVVETKMDDLTNKLNEVGQDVKEIKGTLNTALAKELADHVHFEDRLQRLESVAGFWRWLSPTLAAIVGSLLTFLIIHFLNNL